MIKSAFALFIANLLSLCCILIAGVMLWNDRTGWGWFLFAGLLMAHTLGSKDAKEEKDDEEEDD